jgi:PPOX class probable F420-dependent enzyme
MTANTRSISIPDSVRAFLETGPFAHVVTLGPDGTPHVTLAWAGLNGDELVFATFFNPGDQFKYRNITRDPRVTLSFEAKESGGEALWPYLVISGRARVTQGGAMDVMDRLAEYYIGPRARYPYRDMPEGVVTHVTIEKIYGQGPWRKAAKVE